MNIVDFVNRFQYFFAKYFSLVANILLTGWVSCGDFNYVTDRLCKAQCNSKLIVAVHSLGGGGSDSPLTKFTKCATCARSL